MTYLKRVIGVIVFVIGLIAMLFAGSYLFIPKNNMKEFGMEESLANGILGEKEQTIDVLVLGDSESYSSISPMEMWKKNGYTAYVCGTSGQTLDYTLTLLQRTFEKQSPKIVILETNAIYREIISSSETITKLSNYFSIFRYHNRWKSLNWNDFKGNVKFTWTDECKGYRFNQTVDPVKATDYMKVTKEQIHIKEKNLNYINEIKSLCDDNGAQLIFLSTPSTINWNYRRHNGIQALADAINCEYVDLNLVNHKIGIDWEKDTRDKGDHLNHFGAVKVTAYLSEYLAKKNILTDHRDDPEYARWENAWEKYQLLVT